MKLVIAGPPRTKKTSQRIFRSKGGRPFVMPSASSADWEQAAILQLRSAWKGAPLSEPVAVSALVYRDADRGDLTGYLQAVGDALERAGVVVNDKLIHSWDGSRKLIDRARPRVEIEIGTMPAIQPLNERARP